MIDDITADLKRDEGLRLKAYTDTTGHVSIGFGRNLTDVGVSENEALYMLERDIQAAISGLDAGLSWWRRMPEPWQRALVNQAFNLGLPKLMGFRKMLDALQGGDGNLAAQHAMDSLWAKQVGERAVRIANLYRSETNGNTD